MAATVNVPGLASIKVDTGGSNALELLGYSINGVEIEEMAYFGDVQGDENGGDEGPPIDTQDFGRTANISIEMSKWDPAIMAKLETFRYGGTAGVIGTSGVLMSGVSFRLCIDSVTLPRNFLRAFPRDPIYTNRGTKYARVRMRWQAHGSSGTLWNTTVSG